MKRWPSVIGAIAALLLPGLVIAQTQHLNPAPYDVWTYFGPSLGGGWGAPPGGGTGSPGGTSGQFQWNNAGSFGGVTIGGDFTVNTTTGVGTLANSGVTLGTYGDATHVPQCTYDVKGRATSCSNVVISGGGGGTGANPTATAGPTAVNGVATTFMRSDAAPLIQKGTNAQFGIVEGDGSTITCVAGVCTAIGGSATSIVPGTTTIGGATSPCLIENSTGTTMACAAVGTGVVTALGANVGSAGAPVLFNGALGTPSSGTGTNITAIPNVNVNAVPTASGTTHSLTGPREYWFCTGTCTVTPPVPVAGYEFCVMDKTGTSGAITMAALGSSSMYPKTDSSAFGTPGTGRMVSGSGTAGNKICLIGLDSTHYELGSYNGTWTVD